MSVKGVLRDGDAVVLVGNSRGEWELPGGKLEPGETPKRARGARDREEPRCRPSPVRCSTPGCARSTAVIRVLVLIYGCRADAVPAVLESPEGRPAGRFRLAALDDIPLPAGYRRAVDAWFASVGPFA